MARQESKTEKTDSEFVQLDYDGYAGRDRSGRKIKHVMSPLSAAKPVAGVMSLVLQPGFNRILAKTWASYTDFPDIDRRIKERQIKPLGDVLEIDEGALTGMIERSYCHDSLKWLRSELETASILDKHDRTHLTAAIDAQLRKAASAIKPSPYVRPATPVIQSREASIG
jgi:hypothetical protein